MTDTASGTPQVLLAHHLKALKLPTFRKRRGGGTWRHTGLL